MALLIFLIVATCSALLSAAPPLTPAQIDRLDGGQVRISLTASDLPHLLETSPDGRSFRSLSWITNAVVLSADKPLELFRVSQVLPLTESYTTRVGLTQLQARADLKNWCLNLAAAGLLSNVAYMASFRPGQTDLTRTNLPALVGGDALANFVPPSDRSGLLFDGSFHLSFPNPLPVTPEALSLFVVFATPHLDLACLVGNDGGESQIGPALWVGGNPYIGLDPENLGFTVTANGRAHSEPGFREVRTANWGNQLVVQSAFASASARHLTLQSGLDRPYSFASATPWSIANPGPQWRLGATLNNSFPFRGSIYFLTIFDRALTSAETAMLQTAYQRTLGRGLPFPQTHLVIEGDSFSEEAFGTEYAHWLRTAPNWAGQFDKKNIARFHETTAEMLAEFDTEVPVPRGGSNFLFLWGGRNDLDSTEPQEIFHNLQAYWRRARAAGYRVAAFTLFPAAYEQQAVQVGERRRALNELIRQAADRYDWLVDVDRLPALQDTSDRQFFQSDGAHLTAAGSQEIAHLINQLILPPPAVIFEF